MAGYPDASDVVLTNMPTRAELKTELIGPAATNPNNLFDRLQTVMQSVCSSTEPEIVANCDNSQVRTRAVIKAMCTATLGSAVMLIQ